jgi:hypothetical protein
MKSEKKALTDSKPVKRTTKSSTAATTATPKTASHRHSKVSVPVTPVEEVAVITVAPTPQITVVAPAPEPSPEDVARLAHAFWAERNFAHGFAEEDWFRAEKALAAAR